LRADKAAIGVSTVHSARSRAFAIADFAAKRSRTSEQIEADDPGEG
jgi:hypothetical protein